MKPGTLDVIVPAHNAGRFLGATLQSVALQHVLPRSVIVVDDRSTDDTAAVAIACAADYADFLPIRLLHNTGPRGPSAARNLAIRHSDAEFVALLDADDLVAPVHHQLLLSAIQAAPGIVVAFGDSTEFNAHGEIVRSQLAKSGVGARKATTLANGIFTPTDGMFAALLGAGAFGTSACIIRRQAVLEQSEYDLRAYIAGYEKLLPDTPVGGWIAVSQYMLHEQPGYAWLRQYAPVATVGASILLYHLPENANE